MKYSQKTLATIYVNLLAIVVLGQPVSLPINYGSNITVNTVRSWDANKRTNDANKITTSSSVQDYPMVTQYTDGLGRPLQTVSKGGSLSTATNSNKDMIKANVYDELGRQVYDYLPFAANTSDGNLKSDPFQQQSSFYSDPNGILKGQSEIWFYGQTNFEGSPLNRIVKTLAPGNSWVGNNVGISTGYDLNYEDISYSRDNVRIWNIGYSAGSLPANSSSYRTGQLFRTTAIDENGKMVIIYTDKSGNTILKKVQDKDPIEGLSDGHEGSLCTYYVYDDFGRQRFIIPPKAVVYLETHNWVLSADVANELCFSNEYDSRGRLIVKKSPGADPVYLVYDQRDRLVFSQDGNQRHQSPKKWLATVYDNLDRPTLTGLIDYNSTREDLQNYANTISNSGGNDAITVNSQTPSVRDLVAETRDATISDYKASNSITFNPGFESEPGANFVAEIATTTVTVNNNIAINGNSLPPNNNLCTLTLSFYDDYSYNGAKSFSNNFIIDNSVAADESETVQESLQTIGYVTGTKVRLLDGSNTFLTTTSFYDEKGRNIQLQSDNHKGFKDEITTQYDFSGKVRSTYEISRFDGAAGITVFTKNTYDILGRVTDISKSINGSPEKTIASYSYDALGRLSNKKLAPGFAGPDGPQLESLNYTYNIQGRLLGINKDYAASDSREGHFFGMELGYDKAGTPGFTHTQTNGNIAGNAWKTRSDNTIRKYDYDYDNVNQLTVANFNQRNTSGAAWAKDKMDFTSNYSYDENGNIKTQNQWGVAPGASPQQIDRLAYNYEAASEWTNKLKNISESAATATNGNLGDFKNGTAGAGIQQYAYDYNGNLQKDLNKEIGNSSTQGIEYNYMNLPTLITFPPSGGRGAKTISYIYDAAGNKLRKILDEPANGSVPARHVETDYLNGFVYQNKELQFFSHEEGRVRVITPYGNNNEANFDGRGIPLPNGKQGVFDYFIKDQLTNVRMILTEEVKRNSDVATMEDADPNIKQHEESVFGQLGSANEVSITRTDKPTDPCGMYSQGWMSNGSARVSKVSGMFKKVGPNVILKVMSGDKISAKSDYYYKTNNNTVTNNNLLNDIVTSLVGTMLNSNASNALKGNSGVIQSTLSNETTSPLNNLLTPERPPEPQVSPPKGYLNIVFFDEQFNYVNSYFTRVNAACDDSRPPLTIIDKEAPKNGWAYVYLSNESDEPVYFDDLQVTHERGRIIEENHYYSYGLKIEGISSRAQETVLNKYGYQGDFGEHDEETGLDEFDLRHYDSQIGRWTTTDPYEQFESPYLGMGNNPVRNIDPDGGWIGDSFIQDFAIKHFLPAIAGAAIGAITTNGDASDKLRGAAWGFGIGMGVSYVATEVRWGDVGNWFGRLFQPDQTAWILSTGEKISWYEGKHIIETYRATSGYEGLDINGKYWNLQFAKYQNVRNGGPVPEGDYYINLIPNPNRIAKADVNKGGDLIRSPQGGIEKIPEFVENPNNPGRGWSYPEWGTNRAHLEPINVWGAKPSERDFSSFYLHDSHKGYSHGCTEVQTGLFNRLINYRSMKNERITVKVRYSNSEHKTNGGTKY